MSVIYEDVGQYPTGVMIITGANLIIGNAAWKRII